MAYSSLSSIVRRFVLLITITALTFLSANLFIGRPAQAAFTLITVNDNGDSGTCSGGTITLRCAIAIANANTTSPTMINFNFNGVIGVTSALAISNTAQPITIDGSGHNIAVDGGNTTQIFGIVNGIVTLSNLTLNHGIGAVVNNDPGIVTINNSVLTHNTDSFGGAVETYGTLTINNSVLSHNSATAQGGAVYDLGYTGGPIYTTTINNNTISGNFGPDGGGIAILGGNIIINSSTVSGNTADYYGGGIYMVNPGTLTMSNSTIANNAVKLTDYPNDGGSGGGIYFVATSGTISNSTISENSAVYPGSGGGIEAFGLVMLGTIIAGNTPLDVKFVGVTSLGHNMLGDNSDTTDFSAVSGDQINVGVNAKLDTLSNNGGFTETVALLAGSAAIGKGDCSGNSSAGIASILIDQRGFTRKSPCDVGAYESNPTIITDTPTPSNTATNTFTPTNTSTSTSTVTATNTSTSTATASVTPSLTSTRIPSAIDSIGVYQYGTFYLGLHNATGMADLTVAFNPSGKNFPIVGDWTGSGYDAIGVYDQNSGNFTLCTSNVTANCAPSVNQIAFTLGNPNDTPLAGKWQSGATHAGAGVYRPGNGLLYVKNQLTTGFADHAMVLGIPGDQGIAGDWTGKGSDSTGVYRPANSLFYLNNLISDGILYGDITLQFGTGGSAFTGDWIGQGHDGVGLYNTTIGTAFLKNALTSGFADNTFAYGAPGSQPIAGHWQVIYPPRAPIGSAPIVIPKTAIPYATPNGGSVLGGNGIGG